MSIGKWQETALCMLMLALGYPTCVKRYTVDPTSNGPVDVEATGLMWPRSPCCRSPPVKGTPDD